MRLHSNILLYEPIQFFLALSVKARLRFHGTK